MCYSSVMAPQPPSPSAFRADVIVFFGTTPASFTVVLCIFVVSSYAKCTFASVAWLWDTLDVSWPTGLSSLALETIAYSLWTNHGAACSNPINTYLQPVMLPRCIQSLCHLPFTSRCAYRRECELVRMCPTRSCEQYVFACESVCTDFLSCSVFFYSVGTNWWQPLIEPLWLSAPFFLSLSLSPELKKLQFSPVTQIFMSSYIHSSNHILATHRNDMTAVYCKRPNNISAHSI